MDPSDIELLARYREGDGTSLEMLVWRYRRQLFAYIVNMTGNPGDADDIFQDVWFKAIRKVGTFRGGSFLGWLTRIARNVIIDGWRANRPTVSMDDETGPGREAAMSLVDEAQGAPDAAAEAEDVKKRVNAAVATLPVEQREVVVMRMRLGLSFKEIAAAQGVSINTALARMQYALARLRKTIGDDGGAAGGEQ